MPAIPKRLGHIWIGPKPAPTEWMETWPKAHPEWSYVRYGNDTLTGFPFRLRSLINEYAWRGAWAGVQDMMRYELLYHYGGFMADADAICLHPVDELLDQPRAYTVYDRPETDKLRGVCPILACEPGNPFVGAVIDRLAGLEPWELRKPEVSTGNRFLMRMIRELAPGPERLHIWPTHYFVPWQKSAPDVWYDGPDTIYAEQKWGTSMWSYNREGGPSDEVLTSAALQARKEDILQRLSGASGTAEAPAAHDDVARLSRVRELSAQVPELLQKPEVIQDFHDLNMCLEKAMNSAGTPARFHGAHFYRHMQQQPLLESNLRTRSDNLRRRLLGWLGTAQNALVIGYDTGHLLPAAMQLAPVLQVVANDPGRWMVERDPNPPARSVYVPAAAEWLSHRYHDRLVVSAKEEGEFLDGPAARFKPADGYDLILFATVDFHSLRVLQAARPLLSKNALVVAASPDGSEGYDFADRVLVQAAAFEPIWRKSFGGGRGSLSAFRLRGDDA